MTPVPEISAEQRTRVAEHELIHMGLLTLELAVAESSARAVADALAGYQQLQTKFPERRSLRADIERVTAAHAEARAECVRVYGERLTAMMTYTRVSAGGAVEPPASEPAQDAGHAVKGSVWRNRKNGKEYVVLDLATDKSPDGPTGDVLLYAPREGGPRYVRNTLDFLAHFDFVDPT